MTLTPAALLANDYHRHISDAEWNDIMARPTPTHAEQLLSARRGCAGAWAEVRERGRRLPRMKRNMMRLPYYSVEAAMQEWFAARDHTRASLAIWYTLRKAEKRLQGDGQ